MKNNFYLSLKLSKFYNSIGLTLTELIVSVILVGIVAVGVVSMNVVIKQLQNTSSRSSLVILKATRTLNDLSREASFVTGDAINSGVRTYSSGSWRVICFRLEGGDPSQYTDDSWNCYYHDNSWVIGRCLGTSEGDVPPSSLAECASGATVETDLVTLEQNSPIFYDVPGGCPDGACAPPNENRMTYIEFTIQAIYDNAQAAHPIRNPQFAVTTRVNPIAHSR